MKIITNDAVYVQKNDIIYLNTSDIAIPASTFLKFFGDGIVIVDDSNRYEFFKYEEREDIKFFEDLDWIINYDEVKNLSENEIMTLAQTIQDEMNELAEQFNSMTDKEKEENQEIVKKYKLLEFKFYSLRDFYWFKQGNLKFELPDGIEYPKDYVQEKRINKLINRIFKKNN